MEMFGTVKALGAFYFLVPLPDKVGDEEAVDILARQFGLPLMPGACFGASGYIRLCCAVLFWCLLRLTSL